MILPHGDGGGFFLADKRVISAKGPFIEDERALIY